MNSRDRSRSASLAGALVGLCLALLATFACLAAFDEEFFASNDYAQYASGAENLLAGHGYATSLLYYDEHYHLGTLPTPQTVFPPGLSLLIAAAMSLGLPVGPATLLVNFLAYHLVALALYAIARDLRYSRGAALAMALFWYGFTANWFNIVSGLSELPFTLATVVTLYAIGRQHEDQRPRTSLIAGLGSAAAVLIRYAGLFHVVSLFIYMALRCFWERSRRSVADFVVALAPPCVTLGALFGRNYALVGDFKGGNDEVRSEPILRMAVQIARSAPELLGFDLYGIKHGHLAEWSCLGLLAVVATCAFTARRGQVESYGLPPLRSLTGANVFAVIYVAASLAALTYLEARTSIHFTFRMSMPLIPFGILIAANGASDLLAPLSARTKWALAVATAIVFALGQYTVFEFNDGYHQRNLAGVRSIREALARDVGGQSLQAFLGEATADGGAVLALPSQTFGIVAGVPTLAITPDFYTDRAWTTDTVHDLVRQYHVRAIVFFPRLWRNQQDPLPPFYAELLDGKTPPWLAPRIQADGLYVYEAR